MNQDLLLRKLKSGQESAYSLLFKDYYKLLTMYATKYVNDLEVAKEIVQDLFVHLYEKRSHLDIKQSLKSYLFRSVHNRCLNYVNSLKTKNKYAEHFKNSADQALNQVDKEMEYSEMQQALSEAISKLPPKCRQIFTMNRFEGLSNSEIAEKLTLSKRTVETQISKALKILRGKMEPFMVAQS